MKTLICRLKGHDNNPDCERHVYPESNLMQHLHWCRRCNAVTFSELSPIPPSINRQVMEAMGIELVTPPKLVPILTKDMSPPEMGYPMPGDESIN